MTIWTVTAIVLTVMVAATIIAVLRGGALDRVIALHLAGELMALLFVVVAVASGRETYLDVAIVLAVVVFAGGLAYARMLERWL